MLPYSAFRGENRGFTLIEITAATLIAGILAAIAVPSFYGLLKSMEVDRAIAQLQGSVLEAQRQAIRQSKTCSIAIDTTNKKIAGTGNCDALSHDLPSAVTIQNNGGNPTFDYRGQTTSLQTIVIANASQSKKKCLVVSNGIGMIRTGNYTGSLSAAIVATSCITS